MDPARSDDEEDKSEDEMEDEEEDEEDDEEEDRLLDSIVEEIDAEVAEDSRSAATKNFCDACFGLCKRSLKAKDVLTPKDVFEVYTASAKCNQVELADNVVWYDWKAFLGQFFNKQVPRMSAMHNFEFRPGSPGVGFFKEYDDTPYWTPSSLFADGVTANIVRNPTGDYRPLSDFMVNADTYAPMDKIVKPDPATTRRQYLHMKVIYDLLTGDLVLHRNFFFWAGGPLQGEPPVMEPLPPTTAAAAKLAATAAVAAAVAAAAPQPHVPDNAAAFRQNNRLLFFYNRGRKYNSINTPGTVVQYCTALYGTVLYCNVKR